MELWEKVKKYQKDSEDKLQEFAEGKATFLINFGEGGRVIPDLISKQDTLVNMIVKVFGYYNPDKKTDKAKHCNNCGSLTQSDYHSCPVCGVSTSEF